jgi:hypothetical protein
VAQGKAWKWRASLVVGLVLGCGGNDKEYAQAVTGLAGTIGATAIYRAHTGGCWANCSPGYACDRKRGTCYRAECVPACAPNETCFVEDNDRFRCVDTLGAGQFGGRSSAPVTSSAPVSSAASPTSSASRN